MTKKHHSRRIFNINRRHIGHVSILRKLLDRIGRKEGNKIGKKREFEFIMKFIILKWQNPNDLPYRKYIKRVK